MPSFNITAGTNTTQQILDAGQTGRVASGASLALPVATAVVLSSLSNNVFNGSFASPTLDNAGTISSGGTDTLYVDLQFTGTIYIRNTGTIVSLARQALVAFNDVTGSIIFDNAGILTSQVPRTVEFGGGNDMFVVRNGSSTSGAVEGNDGTDWLNYASWTGSGVNVQLGGAATGLATNTEFEGVYGSAQDDTIRGGGGNDTLVGLDGADSLSGAAGNDTLWGATGNDTMMGDAGDDILYGGTGSDVLLGGDGDDIYQVTDAGDLVTEAAGQGTDAIFATVSWTASSGDIEAVYAVGAGLTLTGSGVTDALVADASGSTLSGAGGADILYGAAGADSLAGGTDADILRGGGGNDTLVGGADNDQLVGGNGADVFAFDAPGWGYDQIFDFLSGTDRLDMRGSGAASLAALTIYTVGGSTVVVLDTARIDLYGVSGLGASDFIFS